VRAYFFGNYYLSQIQQGIQAAHCVGELFSKYGSEQSNLNTALFDWADQHKTLICLNGGNQADLQEVLELFKTQKQYPFAYFAEDKDSLNNALTCVGIVLPAYIYEVAQFVRGGGEIPPPSMSTGNIVVDGMYLLKLSDLTLVELLLKTRLA
jgi:hypothetical protein